MDEYVYGIREKDRAVMKYGLRDSFARFDAKKQLEKKGFKIVSRKEFRDFQSHKSKIKKRRINEKTSCFLQEWLTSMFGSVEPC